MSKLTKEQNKADKAAARAFGAQVAILALTGDMNKSDRLRAVADAGDVFTQRMRDRAAALEEADDDGY